jgi:spore coat polysaccharide biosynthesis protein SpsF
MYICFLTVRLGSKRLKNKVIKKLGKLTFIEHSIVRCKKNNLTPIICTTNNIKDKIFEKYAKKYKIKIFYGSEKNKIKRWLDCAKFLSVKKFHTLDVDDPFFDYSSIKKSLNLLSLKKKYELICPSNRSREGGASEGYSFFTQYLEKIVKKEKLYFHNKNLEMIDGVIKNFKRRTLSNSLYETKLKFRMTLDYQEDYEFFKKIFSIFGHFVHRKRINRFLDKNPSLRNINFFRNKEWKKKQNKLIMNA